jgi:rhodanese-related sulfurtransferase
MFIRQKYNKKLNLKSRLVFFALSHEMHIFHLMKINFTKILTIIVLSSLLGLVYNYINPSGLKFTSNVKELRWATDSVLISSNKLKDTLKLHPPLNQLSGTKISPDKKNVKVDKYPNATNTKVKKNESEDTGFGEPLLINLEQAYKLYQMDMLFIDARDGADYNEGHIKKSLSLPYHEFDNYKTVITKIPKSQTIIVYCGGDDCELSKALANRLFFLGYHNIYVFSGGWGQWKSAGYPTE